jgi:hypothetical protein
MTTTPTPDPEPRDDEDGDDKGHEPDEGMDTEPELQ